MCPTLFIVVVHISFCNDAEGCWENTSFELSSVSADISWRSFSPKVSLLLVFHLIRDGGRMWCHHTLPSLVFWCLYCLLWPPPSPQCVLSCHPLFCSPVSFTVRPACATVLLYWYIMASLKIGTMNVGGIHSPIKRKISLKKITNWYKVKRHGLESLGVKPLSRIDYILASESLFSCVLESRIEPMCLADYALLYVGFE